MDHLIGNSDLSGAITKSLKHPDHVQYYDMVLQIQKPKLCTTETGVMHIYDVSDDTISFPGLVLGKNAIAQYEQTTKKTLKLEELDLINVNIKVVLKSVNGKMVIVLLATTINSIQKCNRQLGKNLMHLNSDYFIDRVNASGGTSSGNGNVPLATPVKRPMDESVKPREANNGGKAPSLGMGSGNGNVSLATLAPPPALPAEPAAPAKRAKRAMEESVKSREANGAKANQVDGYILGLSRCDNSRFDTQTKNIDILTKDGGVRRVIAHGTLVQKLSGIAEKMLVKFGNLKVIDQKLMNSSIEAKEFYEVIDETTMAILFDESADKVVAKCQNDLKMLLLANLSQVAAGTITAFACVSMAVKNKVRATKIGEFTDLHGWNEEGKKIEVQLFGQDLRKYVLENLQRKPKAILFIDVRIQQNADKNGKFFPKHLVSLPSTKVVFDF